MIGAAARLLHEAVLDVLFPRKCLLCGKEGGWWCQVCLNSLIDAAALTPVPSFVAFPAYYLFNYEDSRIKTCIHTLKYEGLADAANDLIEGLVDGLGLRSMFSEETVWVPVPSSKRRLRERGYNQTVCLAEAWQRSCGGSVWPEALIHHGQAIQVGSTAEERKAQAAKAFGWTGEVQLAAYARHPWVLVDDVFTTGSTMSVCYQCLSPFAKAGVNGLALACQK